MRSPVRDRLTLDGTPFAEREFSRLWFLAALTYGVGDIVTTAALVDYAPRVVESNALVRLAVETFGSAGLVGVKLVALLACLGVSLSSAHAADRLGYYLPPVALAVVGAFTTAFNVRLMLG